MAQNPALLVAIIGVIMALVFRLRKRRASIPQHDSILTGKMYYEEVMTTRNSSRFLDVTRMTKETFCKLKVLLMAEGLKDSKKLCAGEKMMIFLQVLKGYSIRNIAERFQHSYSTISIVIHQVSASILKNEGILFQKHKENSVVHDRILKDPKYYPYFDNCDGALDGTHIPAILREEDQSVFRNRKKFISQNVLGVTNFDAIFIYALAGWEGSAHDAKVLNDAKEKGLPMRQGKFYLADAGYALSRLTLTPYRGVRYHLKEWGRGNQRPADYKELFNLRHSALRNVVERIFGIMKKRFPILVKMASYSFVFQCDLVYCCMLLQNFIRMDQIFEDIFDLWEDVELPPVENNIQREFENLAQAGQLNQWRDSIALPMWEAYQDEVRNRGI